MKYIDMPLAMWLIFAKSFRNKLTTVLGIEPAKAKEITKKAKRKYKEIIARIPAMCRLDYSMSEAGGVTNFVREYTLASGGPYCDCGYKKR